MKKIILAWALIGLLTVTGCIEPEVAPHQCNTQEVESNWIGFHSKVGELGNCQQELFKHLKK